MPNIIFKSDISNNILYDFLNLYCCIENGFYIMDKLTFKKYEYNNKIQDFFNLLKDYYKNSKKYYLERDITYNNLLTIIRHICKYNNIEYNYKIKYDKNKYYINYYIKNVMLEPE